jgi:hypothetical protein
MIKNRQSEKGIALLLVMSAIAILTYLLADFTYETKVQKIKAGNQQDRVQARLNAESALNYALAQLKIYREAFNLFEKNEEAKKYITADTIQGIFIKPFMYPIPKSNDLSLIQRSALDDFEKSSLIQGQLMVEITPITGFLNPNSLRIPSVKDLKKKEEEDKEAEDQKPPPAAEAGDDEEKSSENNLPPHLYVERELIQTLKEAIKEKSEQDESFTDRYPNINPTMLIKELSFYVNDESAFDGPELGEIQGKYNSKNITAKHAPMVSLSEMHLLEGWTDELVNLIIDRLSVHQVSIIDLNKMNKFQLKSLFNNLNDEQVKNFFAYRDGDAKENIKAKNFKSEEDFKNAVTGPLALVGQTEYDRRIKEFAKAGIRLGVAGKLFRVIAQGDYGRASYKIIATIDLPVKPVPPKKKKAKSSTTPEVPPINPEDETANKEKGEKEKVPPIELLEPRIVDLEVQ